MDQRSSLKSCSRNRIFEFGDSSRKITVVVTQLSRDFLAIFAAENRIEKIDTPLHRQRHRGGWYGDSGVIVKGVDVDLMHFAPAKCTGGDFRTLRKVKTNVRSRQGYLRPP